MVIKSVFFSIGGDYKNEAHYLSFIFQYCYSGLNIRLICNHIYNCNRTWKINISNNKTFLCAQTHISFKEAIKIIMDK